MNVEAAVRMKVHFITQRNADSKRFTHSQWCIEATSTLRIDHSDQIAEHERERCDNLEHKCMLDALHRKVHIRSASEGAPELKHCHLPFAIYAPMQALLHTICGKC